MESEFDENPARVYEVILAPVAAEAFAGIASKGDLLKVDKMLQILDTVPDIGRLYDPVYEAARPPFAVKVVYAGHYGIYYDVDEEAAKVNVLFIEDQRRDPLGRFGGAGR